MSATLTPSDVIRALEHDLLAWEAPTGLLVSVAAEPYHVLELLAETASQARVILLWAGDEAIYDGAQALGIANMRFEITLSHGSGLAAQPGKHLHHAGVRPPLAELAVALRARIRSLHFPADESSSEYLEYKGCEPVVLPDGMRLHAYTLTFEMQAALEELAMREAVIL